ncbi:AAA family ATPase [Actinoallomurus liliacearum]|uniref:AAA family ATPase n=1 Tax=Actinoallomurus liliacearum TaxID=1080073 RepID=A0ABP8TY22_9ACTN
MSEIDRRWVRDLAARLRTAPARAGRTRVIAIDGRSGSGKSTLAASLHRESGAPVVSLEDLYGGWDGLEHGVDLLVAEVLAPLAAERTAYVPRYDWTAARWRTPIELSPPALLIVEGVGAGARRAAGYASVLVWLEAGERTRRRRALDRDGDAYAPHWERWAAQEAELLTRETTWDRADVALDTDAGPGSWTDADSPPRRARE